MSSQSRSSSVSSVRSRSREIISSIRAQSTDRASRLRGSSRSRSPARFGRLGSKLNLPFSRSANNSIDNLPATIDAASSGPRATGVRRWDGNSRTTTKWDSIRQDPELWLSDGDCLVHFYDRGLSRKGASLRVSLTDIQNSDCGPLLARHYFNATLNSFHSSQDARSNDDSPSGLPDPYQSVQHEFYVPAPEGLSRDDAYRFHLTTRNFFAWMYEKPLVADRLGQALISLLERMNEYRYNAQQNLADLRSYLDDQGYTDFRDCPDHALAVLQFAEKFQLKDLWTDAFVHCVGMNDRLDSSAEFERVSRASQALITRAHIEMQVRLERGGRSMSDFLEEELSGEYLGLSKEAYAHLERFRSFLHSFYVGQLSYWPPPSVSSDSTAFPQSVYRSLYFEFRNLYDYLVDSRCGTSVDDKFPMDGGMSVYQKVLAFDRKHKYTALPNPLPRVPKVPHSPLPRRAFERFKLRFAFRRHGPLDRRITAAAALSAATNHSHAQIMESHLVQEYLHFEKTWTMREQGAQFSCAEGRRIRWLLVYSILQTLIHVTKIPTEVRDTADVSYPLCAQTAGTPPWHQGGKPVDTPTEKPKSTVPTRAQTLRERILANHSRRLKTSVSASTSPAAVKPDPLSVPHRQTDTASPRNPVSTSTASRTSLRQPLPIRTKSWNLLAREFDAAMASTSTLTPTPKPAHGADIPSEIDRGTPTTAGTASNFSSNRSSRQDSGFSTGSDSSNYSPMSSDASDNSSSDGDGCAMDHHSVISTDEDDGDASSQYSTDEEHKHPLKRSRTQAKTRRIRPVEQARGRDRRSRSQGNRPDSNTSTTAAPAIPAIPSKSAKRMSFHAASPSHSFTSSADDEKEDLPTSRPKNPVKQLPMQVPGQWAGGAEEEAVVDGDDDDDVRGLAMDAGVNRELEAYLSS